MVGKFVPISEKIEELARQIVDAAFKVHQSLGPGLLESVYEACLCYELKKRGVQIERQFPASIVYDDLEIGAGLRIDILVAGAIVVELKAVEEMTPLFEAQLLTYLK